MTAHASRLTPRRQGSADPSIISSQRTHTAFSQPTTGMQAPSSLGPWPCLALSTKHKSDLPRGDTSAFPHDLITARSLGLLSTPLKQSDISDRRLPFLLRLLGVIRATDGVHLHHRGLRLRRGEAAVGHLLQDHRDGGDRAGRKKEKEDADRDDRLEVGKLRRL